MAFVKSIDESAESVSSVLGGYPVQAQAIMSLAQDLLRTGECQLSAAERELVGAYASGVNACTYCFDTHKSTAISFGVDESLLEAMVHDLEISGVDSKLLPVCQYIRKLTLTPARVTQTDVDNVFSVGWDENTFHFVVMICSFFNMMNRIMNGYGVTNTEGFRWDQGAKLADHGYLPS
ncbi:MAG: carboxymuconolactone decarboxylase family protein [Pseudomonadota bacterium]